jgi:hypothetical protein
MRFGTWNVRSLCRAGALTRGASELGKYKLQLMARQEVRWDKGGSQPADDCTLFYAKRNAYHHLETSYFICNGTRSPVTRIKFISDRMSYVVLRGRWCDVTLLKVKLKVKLSPCLTKHHAIKAYVMLLY